MSFLFRKRKGMGAEQSQRVAGVPTPAGIQSMDESLQKKFAKGIQFNSEPYIAPRRVVRQEWRSAC